MTSTEIDLPAQNHAARGATEIGQGTAIEQARAVAEAQAAVMVAQRCPRSVPEAIAQMRESCAQKGLAERAFFRYSRAGSQITGPSVHLARELARCWGNMRYGITELRRDDIKGESEMFAFAEDLQTNTRATTTFIVKHLRDTKNGTKALTDQRDLYENNANNGARRLREQIFAILPEWFTEEAKERCRATIETGGDKPLAARIADIQKAFEGLGVAVDQLERKLGRDQERWNAHDVATLQVIGRSIKNGEATVEDEFPDQKVTLDEIQQQTAPAPAAAGNGRAPGSRGKAAQSDEPPTPRPTPEEIAEHEAALMAEAEAENAAHGQTASSSLFGGAE
jgi:hypothetical protein